MRVVVTGAAGFLGSHIIDRLLGEGKDLAEVAKQLEISEATFHQWRAQYGGLKA